MIIKPGTGIGTVKFGMTEIEVELLLGRPGSVEKEEYIKDRGNWYRVLYYPQHNINFTFDMEDDYRLGTITIEGPNSLLFQKDLFGQPKAAVKSFIESVRNDKMIEDDFTWDENNTLECLEHDSLGILFWFKAGNLAKIECSYFFHSDDETIIWPK